MDDRQPAPTLPDPAAATAAPDRPSPPRVLGIYMIGILPRDLDRSLAFYRALGVELTQDRDRLHFTSRSRGGVVFFVNATGLVPTSEAPRVILEFRLADAAGVEAAFALALDAGGRAYREPELADFGDYLALVLDPDGNVVALSAPADAEPGPALP